MKYKPPPKNVSDFISKASDIVSSHEHDRFGMDCWNEIPDLEIESPIEMLFYVAFKALLRVNDMEDQSMEHVGITPQATIGKYRADFKISIVDLRKMESRNSVVVECDGHEFHEKDEKARRYEKQRDRKMQVLGHKVFRFTGKEITDNPIMVAAEVLAYVSAVETDILVDVNYFTEFYDGE